VGDFNTRRLLSVMFQQRTDWWSFRDASLSHGGPLAVLDECLGPDAQRDVIECALADASLVGDCRRLVGVLAQAGKSEQNRVPPIDSVLERITACSKGSAPDGAIDEASDIFEQWLNAFFTGSRKPRACKVSQALQRAAGGEVAAGEIVALHGSICDRLLEYDARRHERSVRMLNAALYTLGDVFLNRYQEEKRTQRVIDFADLEWQAAQLMSDDETAAYLQMRLDARYRHLLLDEFQDTNPLQWRILQGWLSGYSHTGERPSIFLVGDPKQSIYRFRRADARLFDAARQMLARDFSATVLRTNRTRRNSPAVLSWVNAVFEAACERGDYPIYAHQTTALKAPEGATWLLPLVPNVNKDNHDESASAPRDSLTQSRADEAGGGRLERYEEARRIVAWMQNIVAHHSIPHENGNRPVRWGDFQWLVRRKTFLREYELAMRDAGIPYVSPRRGGLLSSLEALDLSALLEFLMTPDADLALAHVLKSPIFGVHDNDLIALASARAEHETWWACLSRMASESGLASSLCDAHRRLSAWCALAPTLPVHDLLDHLYFTGELKRRYAEVAPSAMREQVLANLDAFLRLSLELDGGRYPSLPKFIAELKDMRRGSEEETPDEGDLAEHELDTEHDEATNLDAVRILTIHAAKGLEAPFVVLLDSNHSEPRAEHLGVLVDWPPGAEAPTHFSAFGRASERGLRRAHLFENEATLGTRENWNLLYVAMTRARQGLLVSGVMRKGEAETWYSRLAEAYRDEACAPYPQEADTPLLAATSTPTVGTVETARVTYQDFCLEWQGRHTTVTAARVPEHVHDFDAAARGEALHALLERMTRGRSTELTCPEPSDIARWLDLDVSEASAVTEAAQTMLRSEALQFLFDSTRYQNAFNEVEMFDTADRLLRIDRLVDTGDVIIVVDYKVRLLPQEHADYAAQLDQYVLAVQRAYPQRKVEAGLATAAGEWITRAMLGIKTPAQVRPNKSDRSSDDNNVQGSLF
jgi:ATP-dependent helicase/nuclease subunit A